MAMLLGKKVGMTQVYDEGGSLHAVTVIEAGPCVVMQVKAKDSDGYDAIQLGYENVKPSRQKKPAKGHAAKAKTMPKRFVREMRFFDEASVDLKVGQNITVSAFEDSEVVDVIGTSKGKGFAGVMKRHGFSGFPASHGTERKHRAAGSQAGFGTDSGQLFSIDEKRNLLVVKGAVPGPSGGYVVVKSSLKKQKKKKDK
jgi:large subunit ribosomal protein L3